jgi:hypothetical protein
VWASVIWGERSTGTEEEHSEDGGDDVQTVDGSGSGGGANPILCLPERDEDDTFWTRADVTQTVSGKNKMRVESMSIVHQRKDLLWKEAVKNEQASLVDHRIQDHIGEHRWQHIVASFVGKHVFQHVFQNVFQYFEWSRSIFFTVEFVLDIIKKHILQYVGNTNKRSRVVNSSPTSLVKP